jgi:thiamine biosynthesis lipoprotein
MEIDLGGIGKEYAVDRAIGEAQCVSIAPVLVNFGGDLRASGPRRSGRPWRVGIEQPGADGTQTEEPSAVGVVELLRGALATSGDSRRFLLRDGVRYSHILEPHTGWPVADAPRSITVAAGTCVEAGTLATFAMLHGSNAESFLEGQGVPFWCLR